MEGKITIKDKIGNILFEYSANNNFLKKTIVEAIKKDVNLSDANLIGADLRGSNLSDADLRGADLRGSNLSDADLRGADLSDADLRGADLSDADLRGSNLSNANLSNANLSNANLSKAYLSNANLCYAYLCYADLSGAYLRGAILMGAVISGAKNIPYIPTNLPEGDFVAWKKVKGKIIKLRVLEDSKRSRATTDKCRCDKALVLEIQDLDGNKLDLKKVISTNYAECKYVVGEIVYADAWDEDRWDECSHGIHFFLDRQSAVDY